MLTGSRLSGSGLRNDERQHESGAQGRSREFRLHVYFGPRAHQRISSPLTHTRLTLEEGSSGLPSSSTTSASIPGASLPTRLSIANISAASPVSERIAISGLIPFATAYAAINGSSTAPSSAALWNATGMPAAESSA